MSDTELGKNNEGVEPISEEEKVLERKIETEINNLEGAEELIKEKDFSEIKIACNRTDGTQERLNDHMSTLQELKIELGNSTQRAVRQWKKDLKSTYTPLLEVKERLYKALNEHEQSVSHQIEQEKQRERETEEQFRREIHQQEKDLWAEKMKAELKMAEKKIEMEQAAKSARSKLPEMKITPFKGTPADWIRFENMFTSQIHNKPLSDEEKFGYLLELVTPTVRDRLSNLKPSTIGYKTAWERLKIEFGQSKRDRKLGCG